jgi:hypothetical protein
LVGHHVGLGAPFLVNAVTGVVHCTQGKTRLVRSANASEVRFEIGTGPAVMAVMFVAFAVGAAFE